MVSSPITSWQIDGETMKTVTDFILGGPKSLQMVTAAIWENGIETCIISYKKRTASLGSMQDTGCLGLVHWDNPEGQCEEGGGRG